VARRADETHGHTGHTTVVPCSRADQGRAGITRIPSKRQDLERRLLQAHTDWLDTVERELKAAGADPEQRAGGVLPRTEPPSFARQACSSGAC